MAKAEVDMAAELADLRERVDRLETALGEGRGTRAPAEGRAWLPGDIDKRTLGSPEGFLRSIGITPRPPRRRQEIREEMIRSGLDPEERLGNSILARMRGYED